MKKTKFYVLLIMGILCLTACSDNKKTETPKKIEDWTVEDFALYDAHNELYNYPENEELSLEYNEEKDKNYQTKRGVKLFSPAKVSLTKYDLSGFYCIVCRYPILASNNDEQNKIEEEYLKKYPDVNEAVKHSNELKKDDLGLYISGKFILQDKKIVQLELDEKGNPVRDDYMEYDNYNISFRLKNDEILSICVEQKPMEQTRKITSTPSANNNLTDTANLKGNEGFNKCVAASLTKIGAKDILDLSIEESSDFSNNDYWVVDAIIKTEKYQLKTSYLYFFSDNQWVCSVIMNNENKHAYYVPDDLISENKIYDYETDKVKK